MATLKRSHAPVPWGAQVEQAVWERSRPGKPRRRRLDRPPLRHDPGWDWDGSQILFSDTMFVPETEEECRVQVQAWEEAHSPILSGRTEATLSLLDVARYQATKGHRKARYGHDDFEVINIPRVVPISEEEPDLWDTWKLGEWEKLDAFGFKRLYSEVAQQDFREQRDPGPSNTPNRPWFASDHFGDDSWEFL